MLEKKIKGDYISITADGVIELRRVEVIVENGVELAKTNWRACYDPLTPIETLPENPRLRAVAEAVWTPELKASWAGLKELV